MLPLFRVQLTQVDATATEQKIGVEIGLTHSTRTMILEAVEALTDSVDDFTDGLLRAQLSSAWMAVKTPFVIEGSDRLYVIHSMTPVSTNRCDRG